MPAERPVSGHYWVYILLANHVSDHVSDLAHMHEDQGSLVVRVTLPVERQYSTLRTYIYN